MSDAADGPTPIDVHDPDIGPEPPDGGEPLDPTRILTIRIDRKEYPVPPDMLDAGHLTGRQIRQMADPHIGPDRDLFEVVPGGSDRKIAEGQRVLIRDHMRFFSAPAVINPGSVSGHVASCWGHVNSVVGGRPDAAE